MKKIFSYLVLTLIFTFSHVSFSQIHVLNTGSVGIGTDQISNNSKVKLTWSGLETDQNSYLLYLENKINSSASQHIGVFSDVRPVNNIGFGGYLWGNYCGVIGKGNGTVSNNVNRYGGAFYAIGGDVNNGVYAKADGPKKNYGVRGYANNGSFYNYAIYGSTGSSGNNIYAGYFQGNVHIVGDLTVTGDYPLGSDKKIKENIRPMGRVLDKLKKMEVKQYNYKQNKKLKLPRGKKYGIIAQDLEKIFPEMVTEVSYPYEEITDDPEHPAEQQKVAKPELVTYKAIYYNQLIPALIKGMQEQQEMIVDLQKRVEKLERKSR